jgi:hypothetical protein
MDKTIHLRRQAEFCLRLSQLCSDQPISRHLSGLAASYHEAALRAEFAVSLPESINLPRRPVGRSAGRRLVCHELHKAIFNDE